MISYEAFLRLFTVRNRSTVLVPKIDGHQNSCCKEGILKMKRCEGTQKSNFVGEMIFEFYAMSNQQVPVISLMSYGCHS